ncbi:ATP-binding protein [Actinomadura scrupuli]|uniref:ATP-binding protein n=1 Tax=Actinomadura scrupuli TaxID=559629 RepID=UPI003D98445F
MAPVSDGALTGLVPAERPPKVRQNAHYGFGRMPTQAPLAALSMVAARMGTLAVVQSMANAVGLPRMTLSRYLDLLELVFVIRRVPAWSSNLTTRAISTPKLILTDSGLGGRLVGLSEERAEDPTALVGPLLENFAIGEVARQLSWAEEPAQLFHYRDRDKVEVDMVLEHASGRVIGIEVKAAETVRGDDFRGLRHLADRLGDRFQAGFVLYTGEQSLPKPSRVRISYPPPA